MEISIRHQPSFSIARLALAAGESARAETGAMAQMSSTVDIEAKAEGGVLKSLKRGVLGGESFFITTLTASAAPGWVDVAPNLPGDVIELDVSDGRAVFLQKGSFLAAERTVEIDTKWAGFKNLFGGEGGFVLRCSGSGKLVASCYGALDVLELAEGETVVVDSGHMVAYDETVSYELTRASAGGWLQTAKSGEGFVFRFTGPGRVMTQTRNPDGLITYLSANMPASRN